LRAVVVGSLLLFATVVAACVVAAVNAGFTFVLAIGGGGGVASLVLPLCHAPEAAD